MPTASHKARLHPHPSSPFAYVLLAVCFLLTGIPLHAQSSLTELTRIRGVEDNDVLIPQQINSGRVDDSALRVINSFLLLTTQQSWNPLQLSGTMTTLSASNGSQAAATLTLQDSLHLRLDVTLNGCIWSGRIDGDVAAVSECGEAAQGAPARSLARGFLALPEIISSIDPAAGWSIADQGLVTVDGISLHRITLQKPTVVTDSEATPSAPTSVDLYFDPATHLLTKSVEAVNIDFSDRATYLDCTTYAGYQTINGVFSPSVYRLTRNGIPQWSFAVSSRSSESSFDDSYFIF